MGIPVGTGEELDLARALEHVQMLDREEFYLACCVTLVKRPEDQEAFDAAFERYWSWRRQAPTSGSADERSQGLGPSPQPAGDMRRAWGTPTPAVREPGREPLGKLDSFGLLVYSPDAPPGRREITRLERRQVETMMRLVRRFRRWAATLEGRRYRPSHRGEVDFLRIARASLKFGGEWLTVHRRRRKIQRTRLVVLWDVSGSMEGHGPFLLALIYALRRAIPSTQVFAFSTDIESITASLRGRRYSEALQEVSKRLANTRGGTKIGKCLEAFNRRYRGLVDSRTVVLVFSDGWDLGDLDLLEEHLADVKRRCHLLVWMNPYADRPDFKPEVAGMKKAIPYVDLLVPFTALARRDHYASYFGLP